MNIGIIWIRYLKNHSVEQGPFSFELPLLLHETLIYHPMSERKGAGAEWGLFFKIGEVLFLKCVSPKSLICVGEFRISRLILSTNHVSLWATKSKEYNYG